MPRGATSADKRVRFSDSPKMDDSGLSTNQKTEMFIGDKLQTITGPIVTGMEIRQAAIEAGVAHGVVVTDMDSLKKISALVSKGLSLHGAANDIAREYKFVVEGADDRIAPRAYK
jgi:hypothetical protein